MPVTDHSEQLRNSAGTILYIASLTDPAHPKADHEAHAHHNELEIYHFISGSLSFAFEGKRIPISEGDMLIVANGQLHRPVVNTACRYERHRVLFNKTIFKQLDLSGMEFYHTLCKQKLLHLDRATVEQAGLDTMLADLRSALATQAPHSDFSALVTLMALLIRAQKQCREAVDAEPFAHSEKADAMIRYINEHLADELTYKALACKFYISEKNLYKFFKKETGFTLSDYITGRRIIAAQSLMGAGRTAAAAAAAVGYSDYSVFYRSFVKHVGMTPTAYIKEQSVLE